MVRFREAWGAAVHGVAKIGHKWVTEQQQQQIHVWGFPGGSDGKESACSAGDSGLIPESARSPGEGNGYPLQYPCLENPMGRGAQ